MEVAMITTYGGDTYLTKPFDYKSASEFRDAINSTKDGECVCIVNIIMPVKDIACVSVWEKKEAFADLESYGATIRPDGLVIHPASSFGDALNTYFTNALLHKEDADQEEDE